jgi:[ribosomal protein S5]-alanine N-acetyltransferase
LSDEIETPRLRLRYMSEDFLLACHDDEAELAENLIGLKVDAEWLREKNLMALRLGDLKTDVEYAPWSLRAIGDARTGAMVGHIGFFSRPNPKYLRPYVQDGVELGYAVYPAYRRQGYAVEAIKGLVRWAAAEHGIENFVVATRPENGPAIALAEKLGFEKTAEHADAKDGLEHFYVLRGGALERLLHSSP